ncbi:methionine ABC transporter [Cutibacterium acnes JCM 18909]|nr:methionine ABC transporter [Cutibacterium acnes JCM 18909]
MARRPSRSARLKQPTITGTSSRKKAAAEGINIDVVSFNDYTQPNVALSQGQIDLNAFQHLLFLADYDVKKITTTSPR